MIQELGEATPYVFEMGSEGVIPGLIKGMEGMKRGEKRRITIPPSQAYGSNGRGPIPPNATLVFDLKLLGFQSPELRYKFQDEDFLDARNANNLTKPAIFEYLIRDFFTKPWRYEDAHIRIWKKCIPLVLLVIGLFALRLWGRKKGAWL